MKIVQSWDTAIKAGVGHDASACATFVQTHDGGHRLIDMWVKKLEYPELKRVVVERAEHFMPHAILIEDKASGQSLIQDLKRESGLPIIAVMPQGDKITRFARITPMIEAGKVALPIRASWLAAFEQEVMAFPHGAHDDQVDAFSQYLNWVRVHEARAVGVRRL